MGFKETAVRAARKAKNFAEDWLLPLFAGATIGAAWCGYFGAIKNNSDNRKQDKRTDNLTEVVYHNGSCGAYDRKRIEKLEEDNRVLMRKALETTEGKSA